MCASAGSTVGMYSHSSFTKLSLCSFALWRAISKFCVTCVTHGTNTAKKEDGERGWQMIAGIGLGGRIPNGTVRVLTHRPDKELDEWQDFSRSGLRVDRKFESSHLSDSSSGLVILILQLLNLWATRQGKKPPPTPTGDRTQRRATTTLLEGRVI